MEKELFCHLFLFLYAGDAASLNKRVGQLVFIIFELNLSTTSKHICSARDKVRLQSCVTIESDAERTFCEGSRLLMKTDTANLPENVCQVAEWLNLMKVMCLMSSVGGGWSSDWGLFRSECAT